jgi:hypothetical protein
MDGVPRARDAVRNLHNRSTRRLHESESAMPYVNIRITREGATAAEQKAELIRGAS